MHHLIAASTFWGQLLHPLGYCTGSPGQIAGCRGYNFWSGIGSDISEVTLVIGVAMLILHHTCHVGFCLRPGRHPVEGTGYKTCRKHHPAIWHEGRTTVKHIASAHRSAREDLSFASAQRTMRDNRSLKRKVGQRG